MLFALKLAEFEILKAHKGFAPLMLLDDVFEKLDAERMSRLLEIVGHDRQCQVFISDTHRHRIEDNLRALNTSVAVVELL